MSVVDFGWTSSNGSYVPFQSFPTAIIYLFLVRSQLLYIYMFYVICFMFYVTVICFMIPMFQLMQ